MFSKIKDSVLYLASSDGSELRRVADVGYPPDRFGPDHKYELMSFGLHADVSPDGSRFAYTSCEYPTEPAYISRRSRLEYSDYRDNPYNYDYEIAVVDMNGSNRIRLTENFSIRDLYPVWSPDWSQIAFVSDWFIPEDEDLEFKHRRTWGELYVVSPNGSERKSLGFGLHQPPKWSPDGKRIAFSGNYEDKDSSALMTATADGSEVREVTDDDAAPGDVIPGVAPSWSPDGRRLAYLRFHEKVSFRIVGKYGPIHDEVYERATWALHTVGLDGEDDRLVSALPDGRLDSALPDDDWVSATKSYLFGIAKEISWSPDGSNFLILGSKGGAVINDKGELLHRLPHSHAAWSPDGGRIAAVAWTSKGYGDAEDSPGDVWLYTVDPYGSDRRDLVVIGDDGEPMAANPK